MPLSTRKTVFHPPFFDHAASNPPRGTTMSKWLSVPDQVRVSIMLALILACVCAVLVVVKGSKEGMDMLLRVPETSEQQGRPAVIAYFFQIAPNTIAHLPRLFERVYHPENIHAIHLDVMITDEQIDVVLEEIAKRIPDYKKNSHFVPRQLIVYEGVSMVLNTLSVLSYFLREEKDWDFFINLSGSDYPLVPTHVTRSLLGAALTQQPIFMSLANQSRWKLEFRRRASTFFVDDILAHRRQQGELTRVDAYNPLVDRLQFVPAFAEAWMILPHSFCLYLVDSNEARRMLLSVGHMRGADEFYFASLAYNHPTYNTSILPNAMRSVVWRYEGKDAGQHPFWLDEKVASGEGYRFYDFLQNAASFHARKFEHPESPLMDAIDSFSNDAERVQKLRKQFLRKLDAFEKMKLANTHGTLHGPVDA